MQLSIESLDSFVKNFQVTRRFERFHAQISTGESIGFLLTINERYTMKAKYFQEFLINNERCFSMAMQNV